MSQDSGGDEVLGAIEDGFWEVEVLSFIGRRGGTDVLLRNGRHLIEQTLQFELAGQLKKSTGFMYPKGGICVVETKAGKIVSARSTNTGDSEEEESI